MKEQIKILVTGGRNYSNKEYVYKCLDKFLKRFDVTIIHGAATGLDTLADSWAKDREQKFIPYPANWKDMSKPFKIKYNSGGAYNALAGFKRNELMLKENPDICLAFPGGEGTKDMVSRCVKNKIKVILCDENDSNLP